MPLVFSYGTLQEERVQLATFGRLLQGHRDELVGFDLSSVVAADGATRHANVTSNRRTESRVGGTAFEITDAELAAADQYEHVAAYKRIPVVLASGTRAWVYVDARSAPGPTWPMLRLTGLDHVGLNVTDMDRTLDFYRRLGLTVLRTSGPNAEGVRSAVIQVGGQELNIFSSPGLVQSGREKSAGVDHFCLLVEGASIDEVVAALREAGIEIARGPVQRRDGTALFVHDPDGVRVELQLKTRASG